MQLDHTPPPDATDTDTPDDAFEARYVELLRRTREHLDAIAERRREVQRALS